MTIVMIALSLLSASRALSLSLFRHSLRPPPTFGAALARSQEGVSFSPARSRNKYEATFGLRVLYDLWEYFLMVFSSPERKKSKKKRKAAPPFRWRSDYCDNFIFTASIMPDDTAISCRSPARSKSPGRSRSPARGKSGALDLGLILLNRIWCFLSPTPLPIRRLPCFFNGQC